MVLSPMSQSGVVLAQRAVETEKEVTFVNVEEHAVELESGAGQYGPCS